MRERERKKTIVRLQFNFFIFSMNIFYLNNNYNTTMTLTKNIMFQANK